MLAQLQAPTATPATTSQQQSIPANATSATEGGKEAHEPRIDVMQDETQPT
jgi:hypothetical protein